MSGSVSEQDSPYGCPTSTIDSGAALVLAPEIKTELTLLAIVLALNADTLLVPLLAT